MSNLALLSVGVVLTQYVLSARSRYTESRRVVAWAECMSDRESLRIAQEWFDFCASVNALPAGWYWNLDVAKPGDIPAAAQ